MNAVIRSAPAWTRRDEVRWLGIGQMPCDKDGQNAGGGLDSWLLYSEALRVYLPSRCWERKQ